MLQINLQHEYDLIREEATQIAGEIGDIPRRAMVLHNLYLDSNQNYPFPLIAAHGALWAYSYFEVGGFLGKLIANRYFYDSKERAFRLSLLEEFATAFRRVNRLVCVDTCTNYNFTKRFGLIPGADQFVKSVLLDTLNRVHAACLIWPALKPLPPISSFEFPACPGRLH